MKFKDFAESEKHKFNHGQVRAMLTHHPEKFSKKACGEGGDGDKLCPYAVSTSMKQKGHESHYKDQESSTEGTPHKKKKYKDEEHPASAHKDEALNWKRFLEAKCKCDCDCKNCNDDCKCGDKCKCRKG